MTTAIEHQALISPHPREQVFERSRFCAALDEVLNADRWCTPSILFSQDRPGDDLASETSVSFGRFGSHLDGTGLLGEVAETAKAHRGADHALISVNGTTGSNQIILRMLADTKPNATVLVARNAHHSVHFAAQAFGIRLTYLGCGFLPEHEAVLPPTPHDVANTLAETPDVSAVLITSPTYEGLVANISGIAAVVHAHKPETLLIVDQAWGAHLSTHPALPCSAIHFGADIVCESTHKLGGARQQTGVLLWNAPRVNTAALRRAYRSLVTTSPNFALVASLDAALRGLHSPLGHRALEQSIANAARTRSVLGLAGRSCLTTDHGAGWAVALDPVKVTFSLTDWALSGYQLAAAAEECGIVFEKSGIGSATLISTLQLSPRAPERLAHFLRRCGQGRTIRSPRMPDAPWTDLPSRPLLDNLRDTSSEVIPVGVASGRVAAELVEVYPPGIPILTPGFEITGPALDYAHAVVEAGGHVVADDSAFRTVRVVAG